MHQTLSSERLRLLAVLAAATLIGLIVGQVAWALAIAGIGLSVHALWHGARLLEWMQGGRKPPPVQSGLWAEIFSQLQRQRRKTEARRRSLMDMLKRYSDLANALPDATLIINEHHSIIGGNHAAKHTLGIDNKRDRGQRVDNLIRDPLLLALLNGELQDPIVDIASPVVAGSTLRLRLTDYGVGSRLLLAHDISEQIHNQEMRQAFVANVSHELQTPLTVVNGHLELMLDDPELSPSLQEQLQQVARQGERMQSIVQDLLALARLESAPTLAEGQLVCMGDLIESEVNALQSSAQFPEHQIVTTLDPGLQLHGQRSELESVCHNLLYNALRHTPAGTVVQVDWSLQPNGRPAFSVQDNGPGISDEHLPHLTERFYRADPSRSSALGGTGLGLSIVKHVLQRHGGELFITSEWGKGSRFEALFSAERASST